jgi:hypothetical protein
MWFTIRLLLGRVTYLEWVRHKAKHSNIWKRELAWMLGETNQ